MADVPAWAMAGAKRKSRADLDDLLDQMQEGGVRVPRAVLRTKDDIVRFIESEKRSFWDARHRDSAAAAVKGAPTRAAGKRASTDFSGITASECNAWLRTLPVVPLHGEA